MLGRRTNKIRSSSRDDRIGDSVMYLRECTASAICCRQMRIEFGTDKAREECTMGTKYVSRILFDPT